MSGEILAVGGFLISVLSLMYGYVYPSTQVTVSAAKDLQNGGAALYYAQWQERLTLLEDDSVADVVLEPFSYYPYVLAFDDITEDSSNWKNTAMANWYGKNSVQLHGSETQ